MKQLLQLNNIHVSHGVQVVLDEANLTVSEGQKIGVIGRNGAGKSTLCNIITGHEKNYSGTVNKSAILHSAYLEQHDPYQLDETVIDFIKRYSKQEEWQCGKIAARFQLKNELLTTNIGKLPGGYRTRVKLTAMLVEEPNFLILDEPSNYLDLRTLILLEEFLLNYRGGFLIVSHDREFLRKTCLHTLEIEKGRFTIYPGTVDQFLIFKEEQKTQALKYNKNVEIKHKQLQEFVNRFRAKASKASQARSKQKQIENLKTIDIGHPLDNVRIRIPSVNKKKAIALKVEDLDIGYTGNLVASEINLEVQQGAHVAVLGDNGQGKTTFLRTLAEDLKPKSGICKWGYNLKIGYYAQHIFSALDQSISVHEHLSNVADESVSQQEILNFAGCFLFKGDDVKKKIGVLSGGEMARLYLAGLLLSKSHVLILDEPTNHLDFETVEALGRALREFSGTLFFVSHDRTFVNLVTTEIIEVNNGMLKVYKGNYEDYVYHIEKNVKDEFVAENVRISKTIEKKKNTYQIKKDIKFERRNACSLIRKVEERININTKKHDEICQLFIDDPASWSHETNGRYEKLKKLIKHDEDKWIELSEKIEKLGKAIEEN